MVSGERQGESVDGLGSGRNSHTAVQRMSRPITGSGLLKGVFGAGRWVRGEARPGADSGGSVEPGRGHGLMGEGCQRGKGIGVGTCGRVVGLCVG